MPASHPLNALVTGASQGLGLAFVQALLALPHCNLVYAACRTPSTATALAGLSTLFDVFVGAVPLWTMFGDAQLGPLSVRLLQLRRALQELEPEAHSALGAYLRFAE